MPTKTVLAENVSIGFGRHTVVAEIDFSTDAGALVVLIGTNGSGKSTLLKTLAGMIKPLAGNALVLGAKPGTRVKKCWVSATAPSFFAYFAALRQRCRSHGPFRRSRLI